MARDTPSDADLTNSNLRTIANLKIEPHVYEKRHQSERDRSIVEVEYVIQSCQKITKQRMR